MKTIFVYGPQMSGKTTQLIKIAQAHRHTCLIFSGENQRAISNGKINLPVTAPLSKRLISSRQQFLLKTGNHHQIRFVIIDGAQFLNRAFVVKLFQLINDCYHNSTVIIAGCLYYLSFGPRPGGAIPVSRFLLKYCNLAKPINRRCDFCHRRAVRFWVNNGQRIGANQIVTADPHLVCGIHYHELLENKFSNP